MLASIVRQGLNDGLSGNEMLRQVQAAGLGIQRSSFLQLVGEVRSSASMAERWSTLPLDQVPGPEDIVDWAGGATDTYLHRVYMYVRTNEAGQLAVERRGVSLLTREPLSPADALAMAQDLYDENADNDNYSGDQLLGAEFGGIYHQLGPS